MTELTQFFAPLAYNPLTFYLVVFFYSIASTSFGIGGFVLIPFVALYFGPKESIGLITLFFLWQNINKTTLFFKHIDWKIARAITLWSVPGVIIGAYALSIIPTVIFEKILAIGILVFLTYDIFFKKKFSKKSKTSHPLSLPFFGVFYGATSGFMGSGNMIKGPLFLTLGLTKEFYIGTYSISSLFMNLPKVGMYLWTHIITPKMFLTAIPFVFLSFIGTYIGKKVVQKIESKMFFYILSSIYFGSAILLLLK